jgi:hypothetical protein
MVREATHNISLVKAMIQLLLTDPVPSQLGKQSFTTARCTTAEYSCVRWAHLNCAHLQPTRIDQDWLTDLLCACSPLAGLCWKCKDDDDADDAAADDDVCLKGVACLPCGQRQDGAVPGLPE